MRCASLGAALFVGLIVAGDAGAVCNVTATGINFGVYDVFATAPLDSTGSVSVTCDDVPPPRPVIAIGPGGAGTFLPRRMRHAWLQDTLGYNVFTSSAMSVVWGDGTGGTSTVSAGRVPGPRPPRAITIYGRIPPGQNVAAGLYSDTLVVTITW